MKKQMILLAAVVLSAGCYYGPTHHTQLSRSWPAAQVTELRVKGLNGKIEVVVGAADRVTMDADVHYRGRRSAESLVTTVVDGTTLSVREENSNRGWRWGMITPSTTSVNYVFHVPPQLQNVAATTVNGKIRITGVSGVLSMQSVNGAIDITAPSAELNASTVNGHLSADFQKQFKGARLKTVNGSISVVVPANSPIDCDVHQVNGTFRSDIPMRMNGDAARPGQMPLEATTVNGTITVSEHGKGT